LLLQTATDQNEGEGKKSKDLSGAVGPDGGKGRKGAGDPKSVPGKRTLRGTREGANDERIGKKD